MHHALRPGARGRLVCLATALVLAGCADGMLTEPQISRSPSLMLNAAANLNETPPGYIRIGVVQSATTIAVGGTGDFEVRDKATGSVLTTGSDAAASVTLGSGAVSRTNYRLQVACLSPAGAADLVARAEALGHPTYVEPIAACDRVLIGEFASNAAFGVRNDYRNLLISQGLSGTDSFWRLITLVEGVTEYRVTIDGTTVVSGNPIRVVALTGHVTIAGRPYRGVADVTTNSGGALAGVNELPLEEYLYGVVPRELPPVPYGLPEAQKAQAVTARTYALANMGKHLANGYNLTNTTGDQVYGGLRDEHPVSTAAVDATTGIVAVYRGALISTLYHSTSGGFTANSEDVYANPVAYLRGVPDAERGKALENVPTLEVFKRNANPTNLRAAAGGDFEADWSRYHRWVVEWSAAEMTRALSSAQSFNRPVGTVHAIEVVDRADQGRVREIRFHTDAGVFTAFKDNIRTRLPYVTATDDLASLRSTMFWIEPVTDPRTRAITGWKAYGGGWGHGVGMSQTGAVGMAERGRSYEEILKHYYQGSELAQR
jgi:stage II sporulation protein D